MTRKYINVEQKGIYVAQKGINVEQKVIYMA